MKTSRALYLFLIFVWASLPPGYADLQPVVQSKEAVGTIGYRDEYYFTIVTKSDYTPEGEREIGFSKTDDLILPNRMGWGEVTAGLAVRVRYEEILAPERSFFAGLKTEKDNVLERKAVQLWVGQKQPKKVLAS